MWNDRALNNEPAGDLLASVFVLGAEMLLERRIGRQLAVVFVAATRSVFVPQPLCTPTPKSYLELI